MLRRQARERREYVYKKALESKQRQIYERKQQIRDALASGRPLPPELRGEEAQELAKNLTLDAAQAEPATSIDDENSRAGQYDPRVLITTSRGPSSRLSQFAKELRFVFPNSTRLNRGGYTVHELAAAARANGITDLVMVHEHRGVPDALVVSHFPHGPTVHFTLHNVTLRHEVAAHGTSTVSEQYPHLIFDGFGGRLGERVKSVLRFLFPVPKDDARRVMTFANRNDFVSFRHHVFLATHRDVHLAEVGPRFDMRPYEIRLGTLEQSEADVEWVLRPYMNTARKRSQLAAP